MRTIKFRAWDKEQKEMLSYDIDNDITFVIGCDGSVFFAGSSKYLDEWSWGVADDDTDRLIIMQYTGLKDKNGVEIYEGDVIEGFEELNENEIYSFFDVVIFEPPTFSCDKADFPIDSYDTLEVIGNIYENPELLEV